MHVLVTEKQLGYFNKIQLHNWKKIEKKVLNKNLLHVSESTGKNDIVRKKEIAAIPYQLVVTKKNSLSQM